MHGCISSSTSALVLFSSPSLIILVGMLLFHLLSIAAIFITGIQAKWEAQVERREAVREAFRYNYAKYEELSYPRDLLKPISKSGTNNEVLVG
jgi:hypothetical protein